MSLYKMFGTDKALEKDGVWVEYLSDDAPPIRFKISRSGGDNRKYQEAVTQATKPYLRQIQTGTFSDQQANKIMRKVFAKTVVLDWENVTDRDGQPITFSPTACETLFNDLPDLYLDLKAQSENVALFQEETWSNAAKN